MMVLICGTTAITILSIELKEIIEIKLSIIPYNWQQSKIIHLRDKHGKIKLLELAI